MPRYYRRRYTRTLVKPKKKWASNIKELNLSSTAVNSYGGIVELCKNSTQSALPTPVIVKAGNFKVQCDVVASGTDGDLASLIAYVLYLPEGVDPLLQQPNAVHQFIEATVTNHPEWILSWRQIGYEAVQGTKNVDRVSFSSRLKRNLNSGDRIVFALTSNGAIQDLALLGMCQFWTCAN